MQACRKQLAYSSVTSSLNEDANWCLPSLWPCFLYLLQSVVRVEFTTRLIEFFLKILISKYAHWNGIILILSFVNTFMDQVSPLRHIPTIIFRVSYNPSTCHLKSLCHPEPTGILIHTTSGISVLLLSVPERRWWGQRHTLTTEVHQARYFHYKIKTVFQRPLRNIYFKP